ncbi:hypothetical protein G6F22_019489 [Rhizopus arrhizus]|nr:hypothetical protein G6F22_019489 [Rhizopus arrhizus]
MSATTISCPPVRLPACSGYRTCAPLRRQRREPTGGRWMQRRGSSTLRCVSRTITNRCIYGDTIDHAPAPPDPAGVRRGHRRRVLPRRAAAARGRQPRARRLEHDRTAARR